MNIKRHLLTIRTGDGKVHTFLVSGTTGKDGKTRIPVATLDEAYRQAGVKRGHCIQIG